MSTNTIVTIDKDVLLALLDVADYGIQEKYYQLRTFGESDYGTDLPEAKKELVRWKEAAEAAWKAVNR